MTHDVIVIGGGQAALSVAYFLRRTQRAFLLPAAEARPGLARVPVGKTTTQVFSN